jgi:NADPH-dependent curcumin reductase CurA
VYGVTGLTALLALKTVQERNRTGTLIVSSAAGSTGSYAVQVGRHMGWRVVGIVGDPDKVGFVK